MYMHKTQSCGKNLCDHIEMKKKLKETLAERTCSIYFKFDNSFIFLTKNISQGIFFCPS